MHWHRGVFGRVFAFYGVVEAQGRGTEHMHRIIFSMLCAQVIQQWANDVAFRKEVCDQLDQLNNIKYEPFVFEFRLRCLSFHSSYFSHTPHFDHIVCAAVDSMICATICPATMNKYTKENKKGELVVKLPPPESGPLIIIWNIVFYSGWLLFVMMSPPTDAEEIKLDAAEVNIHVNHHEPHTFTCAKIRGKSVCREGYKQTIIQSTRIVQIKQDGDNGLVEEYKGSNTGELFEARPKRDVDFRSLQLTRFLSTSFAFQYFCFESSYWLH